MTDFRTSPRLGFTAIELVVVLSIISILTTMAVAASLPVIRRARINEAAGAIEQVWREARNLAITTRPDPPEVTITPKHYGVMIKQNGSGNTFVALIWSNQTEAAVLSDPDTNMLHHDPADKATPPVHKFMIKPTFALAWAKGGGAPAIVDPGGLVWYAQYRTGLPIAAVDVVAGKGGSAVATSIGAPGSVIATSLRVQSLDWTPNPRNGLAVGVSIYQAGIPAKEEL